MLKKNSRKNLNKNVLLRIFSGKNGAVEISAEEIIGGLLGVMAILGIAYVIFLLVGIATKSRDYEQSLASFESLGNKIGSLIESYDYSNTNFVYFLGKGYSIAGFSYKDLDGSSGAMKCDNHPLTQTRKKAESQCGKSCICMYKNSDFDDEKQIPSPIRCRSFDKNVIFIAPFEQQEFCGEQTVFNPLNRDRAYYDAGGKTPIYKYLIYKGDKTKNMYLDKYQTLPEQGDELFIFMAEFNSEPNDPIYKRKQFMDDNYNKAIPVGLQRTDAGR